MDAVARFVAIAHTNYAQLTPLPNAVADARRLASLLESRHGYEPVLLANLERNELWDALDSHLAAAPVNSGTLIVLWIGHGKLGDDHTLRLLGPHKGNDVEVADAGKLGEWAARTGARQMLVLIDTCFAAGGLVDATRLANAVLAGRIAQESRWFGIVAASLADQKARSGALVQAVHHLLDRGPREPDMRWNRREPYIRGDDLVQALLANWDEGRQAPLPISLGRARDLVRNPLHEEGLVDEPVEHLLLAARGSAGDESFFTGREHALARIVAWLGRNTPGLLVVTGPPGCGKSALVGRVVSLSAPAERARLLGADAVPIELDPGASRIDAQLQARGTNVDTAATALARYLGCDAAQGLYGVLAVARERQQALRPLVIVVDGLDEARIDSRNLAIELLQPLARLALVIVATRNLQFEDTSLMALLGSTAEVIDLGDDPAATLRDVHRYVLRRLDGVDPTMDARQVADELAQDRAETSTAPFLLARLITSQLRDRPVDTSAAGWRLALASTVESALERDLQGVLLDVGGQTHPAAARELLRALARAHGSGFPADDVWPAVASALSWTGTHYSREHAYDALAALGRHIVVSSQGGQALYRIAHTQLAEYLAADASRDVSRPADFDARAAVAEAIADVYEQWLEEGGTPRGHGYLWQFAWQHLAEAGAAGLRRLETLAKRDWAEFAPQLASGYELAGMRAWAATLAGEAVFLHEKAVVVRRGLNDPQRLALSLFQLSVVRATNGDEEGSREAADEAAAVAEPLRGDPEGLTVLSSALLARAMSQIREGRFRSGKRLADEVIAMESSQPGDVDWRRMYAAHHVGALAAFGLNELAEAERCSRLAMDLADENDAVENDPLVFREACSTVTVAQFLKALLAAPGADGRMPVADTRVGRRLLQQLRQEGPCNDIRDTLTAKGLLFLARCLWLNKSRQAADAPTEPSDLQEVLAETLELIRPHASHLADAAVTYGNALNLRAAILQPSDPAEAMRSLNESAACLRPFAAKSGLVGVDLGITLDTITSFEMLARAVTDVRAMISRQEEAVALLRFSDIPLNRVVLAAALGRLGALLLSISSERSAAAREEAIEVLRGVASNLPEAKLNLAGNLVDQAAYLVDNRTAEAVDLLREALSLTAGFPPEQIALVAGLAKVNLAGALVRLGQFDGTRELLQSAIARLEEKAVEPIAISWLAIGYLNLSHVEMQSGEFDAALVHARQAEALFETPGIPPFALGNRLLVLAALGRAEYGVGAIEEGTRTFRRVIDSLRVAASERPDDGSIVLAIDMVAPNLWDEAIAALGDRPALVQRLQWSRRRPPHELAQSVEALVHAVETVEPDTLREVRQIARMQRSAAAEAFDRAWVEASGSLPAWLGIDSALEWAVITWWNTPDLPLSRDFLAAHPILLNEQTDVLLEELALGTSNRDAVDFHLAVLAAARLQGVAAAYAPWILESEVAAWLDSEEPKDHLAQHPELMRPEVLAWLRARGTEGNIGAQAYVAILELALRGESDLAFDAYAQPESMADQLRSALRTSDALRLDALATIVFHAAEADDAAGPIRRQAALSMAIAGILLKRPVAVAPYLREALASAPVDDRVTLSAFVITAVEHHPALTAELVALLPLINSVD